MASSDDAEMIKSKQAQVKKKTVKKHAVVKKRKKKPVATHREQKEEIVTDTTDEESSTVSIARQEKDTVEIDLHELQLAICSPKVIINVSLVQKHSARIRAISPEMALGQVTEAVELYMKKKADKAIDLLNEAIAGHGVGQGGGGYGAPPGKHNKTPHTAALYAFRARCHLLRARSASCRRQAAADARDDISRTATLLGVSDVLFASRIDLVIETKKVQDPNDTAYLVRMRARCDLLASSTIPQGQKNIRIASATATLEAGGSADVSFIPTIDPLEAEEIEFDLAPDNFDSDIFDQVEAPSTVESSSWLKYESAYRHFETVLLPKAKDATLSITILPLPPAPPNLASMSIQDASSLSHDQRKLKIRLSLLRWHPDKASAFSSKFLPQDRQTLVSTSADITRRIISEKKKLLASPHFH